MKIYADLKAHAPEREIKPGEVVLMRQPKKNKLSTPYHPKPFVVEEKKRSMVTASNGSQTVTRNSSQFKVIPKYLAESHENCEKKDEQKTTGRLSRDQGKHSVAKINKADQTSCQIFRLCTSDLRQIEWSKDCLIFCLFLKKFDICKLFSSNSLFY